MKTKTKLLTALIIFALGFSGIVSAASHRKSKRRAAKKVQYTEQQNKETKENKENKENKELKEFTATYDVRWHGIKVGTSHNSLQKIGKDAYQVESYTKPIFSMLPFEEAELAKFMVKEGQITPVENYYQTTKKGISKKGKFKFDWTNHVVLQEKGKKSSEIPLKNQVYDKITHFLQLRLDLRLERPALQYRVIEPEKERMYSYNIEGKEALKTKMGTYDTIIVSHMSADRKRVTRIWLAPKLDYMIVKLQQTKDGKSLVEVVLKELELK